MEIYRYIPLKYLRNLLATNELFFNKITNWEDPYENFFLKQNIIDISGAPINISETFPSYYGECWTTLKESDAMWRIYSVKMEELRQSPAEIEKVAIKIKIDSNIIKQEIEKVTNDLNYDLTLKEVHYTDSEEIEYAIKNAYTATGFKIQDFIRLSLFVKRNAFEHEHEYRIIIEIPSVNKESKNNHILIPFNKTLFCEYVVDPRLSQDQFEQIKVDLLRMGIESKKIKKSKLYDNIKKRTIIVDEHGCITEKKHY